MGFLKSLFGRLSTGDDPVAEIHAEHQRLVAEFQRRKPGSMERDPVGTFCEVLRGRPPWNDEFVAMYREVLDQVIGQADRMLAHGGNRRATERIGLFIARLPILMEASGEVEAEKGAQLASLRQLRDQGNSVAGVAYDTVYEQTVQSIVDRARGMY